MTPNPGRLAVACLPSYSKQFPESDTGLAATSRRQRQCQCHNHGDSSCLKHYGAEAGHSGINALIDYAACAPSVLCWNWAAVSGMPKKKTTVLSRIFAFLRLLNMSDLATTTGIC
jgi:hypothetical protein